MKDNRSERRRSIRRLKKRSIIIYINEVRSITERIIRIIKTKEMRAQRRIKNKTLRERVRNADKYLKQKKRIEGRRKK